MSPTDRIGTNGAIRQSKPGDSGAPGLPWGAYPLLIGPLSPIAGIMHPSHQVADGMAYGGSLTAVFGGLFAVANSLHWEGAMGGILVGLGGLVTALIPALRVWVEDRRAERAARAEETAAKWERHDLAGKLQVAVNRSRDQEHRIGELERTLEIYRGWMTALSRQRLADPAPPLPPESPPRHASPGTPES